MKNKKCCVITDRDYKLLRFIWKWKCAPTLAIARKFFPGIKLESAYRRLNFLARDGYITSVAVTGQAHFVWTLTEKGFKYLQPALGDLKAKGYKSENFWHDYLTLAFQLGEWLTHQPDQTQTYSEQQLRRYPTELYPPWVPQSSLHRPDGYSIYTTQTKKVIVAFEVELWIKAHHRYEPLVTFYDSEPSIDLVFWLLDSAITFNSLKKNFTKLHMRDFQKHHFILLSDFQKKGWMAQFIEGKYKGYAVSQFLNRNPVESASKSHQNSDALALLDSRKCPTNSIDYSKAKKPKISD